VVAGVTAAVKDELSLLPAGRGCCRQAELSALLRFAGGLHLADGQVVVEAELDNGLAAHRLRREIADLYGHQATVKVLAGQRYLLRVETRVAVLARATGLIDPAGRPVLGLPARVVTAGSCDAAAAWRGAFLARGSLAEPGRRCVLQVASPGPEAALALVGAARRLGVAAQARQVRGGYRVVIGDSAAVGVLLAQLGVREGMLAWQQLQTRRQAQSTSSPVPSFETANQRRVARAATVGVARVQAATALLADQAPQHLLAAGRLRLAHPQASLEELGALADPPMTKDAVAGRLRRLLSLADRHATRLGLPTT